MSTNTEVINIRIDAHTKSRATKAIEKMGLDMSSAIKLFLAKVIQTDSIPFHVGKMNDPRFIAKIKKEVEDAKNHGMRFSSVQELHAHWDSLNA